MVRSLPTNVLAALGFQLGKLVGTSTLIFTAGTVYGVWVYGASERGSEAAVWESIGLLAAQMDGQLGTEVAGRVLQHSLAMVEAERG